MKRVIKCSVILLISLVCLLHCFVFQVACLEYSEDSPSYVTKDGCFYIQVNTSQLGACTIILPSDYQFNKIGTYKNSTILYNTTASTLSGTVITASGTSYNFRMQAFSNSQYYRPNDVGTGSTWTTLTISRLDTTNGSIVGSNGIKVYDIPDSDKLIITILLIGSVLLFVFWSVVSLITRKRGFNS